MSHFNEPNIERKNCVWTTKYNKLLEVCFVQHIEKKCVYISINKTTRFYDCKKRKACCQVLNNPFKDQKPKILLFGGDGTHCFARNTSRDYEKEKISPFLKKFPRQSVPSKSEPAPTKDYIESKYGINVSVSYWLMIWATYSLFKSFCSLSLDNQPRKLNQPSYRKSWSSQSPTTESSGFSNLVLTLLVLQ